MCATEHSRCKHLRLGPTGCLNTGAKALFVANPSAHDQLCKLPASTDTKPRLMSGCWESLPRDWKKPTAKGNRSEAFLRVWMAPGSACTGIGTTQEKREFLPVQTLVLILTMLSLMNVQPSSAKVNQTGLINEKPMRPGRGSGLMGFADKMELMSLAWGKKLQHWKSPPTTWECLNYKSIWQLTLEKTWHSE